MTSPRKPGFVLPVAVTLGVLLGLYVGAYYALLVPDGHQRGPRWPVYPMAVRFGANRLNDAQHVRFVRFFTPIHELDRRIRPHVWEPTP